MKTYKQALSIRGDCLYCPLPFSLDSYWGCEPDCHHCYLRGLNEVWGKDLRAADPQAVYRKLVNGLKNKNPKSFLAHALKNKKTIRFGNKSDPFQPIEKKMKVSLRLLRILTKLDWTFVIQTRFTSGLRAYEKWILEANKKNLITLMPVISPGFHKDWQVFERKKTTPPSTRLEDIKYFTSKDVPVGVNGEPFIPGYHKMKDFEDMIKRLKEYGVKSYNTYNFHFTPFIAKRLHKINIDIERIWRYNQDDLWRPILKKLCFIADKHNIRLGCPDFVNTGWDWVEKANTCCGINVPNPSLFNTHHWKKQVQESPRDTFVLQEILDGTFEGIGHYGDGDTIVAGGCGKTDMYTFKDIK